MRADELPDAQLQEAIAVAKARAVWGAVYGRRVGAGGERGTHHHGPTHRDSTHSRCVRWRP